MDGWLMRTMNRGVELMPVGALKSERADHPTDWAVALDLLAEKSSPNQINDPINYPASISNIFSPCKNKITRPMNYSQTNP